jgi:hypothetical protein
MFCTLADLYRETMPTLQDGYSPTHEAMPIDKGDRDNLPREDTAAEVETSQQAAFPLQRIESTVEVTAEHR